MNMSNLKEVGSRNYGSRKLVDGSWKGTFQPQYKAVHVFNEAALGGMAHTLYSWQVLYTNQGIKAAQLTESRQVNATDLI